jgi:ribonuclease P protein component
LHANEQLLRSPWKVFNAKTNISTENPAPSSCPRISQTHEIARRSFCYPGTSRSRPASIVCTHEQTRQEDQLEGVIAERTLKFVWAIPEGRMNRKHRLTSSTDFKRVRRTGKSYAHPFLILIVARNDLGISRFGFTAGRSLGGAVQRNRAKRRMRAALQLHYASLAPGWDTVLIARPAILKASWVQLIRSLAQLLRRAELI